VTTNVSEVVDNARLNSYHLRILALCALLILFDGFDLGSIGLAAPEFRKLFELDAPGMAPVFSAGLFGLALGALAFGFIGDLWGATRTFVFCGLMFGVFTLLTASATSLAALVPYRFLTGLALGGASPLSIAIASDYCPKRVRTSVVMIMYIGLAAGQIVAAYVYGYLSDAFGWRTVFYVGGLAPIALAPVLVLLLPETLEYLVMKGAPPARINAILRRIEPGRTFAGTEFVVAKENKDAFQPAQLFAEGRAAVTLALWLVFFTSLIAIYFFNTWIPTLLTGSGLSTREIVQITAALQFGGVIGTLVAAPIVLRLGAFRTVALGYLAAALAMIGLGLGGASYGALAAATLAVGVFLIGTQSALNASCASVYPPAIRATGVGWGFGIGRIGSILSPYLAGALLALHWRPAHLFMIAAVPTLVASAGALAVMGLLQRRKLG
jgi:AAHS family 4-hydroxybenzoate transporter-like MFS transporter